MLRPGCFRLESVAVLIVLLASAVCGAQTAQAVKYDKSSEIKIKGVVDDVSTSDNFVHVMLKTDKGVVNVMMAPEKFLKEIEVTFAKGDALQVTGSQATVGDAPVLLAREVNRNGDVMTMRDESGKGAWVGWIK
jgi:hypothetical protein